MQKMNFNLYFTPSKNINLKWIISQCQTIKVLVENIEVFAILALDEALLHIIPKAWPIKEEIKLDLIS